VSNNEEPRKQVPVPVIIAACVALLGLMGWWGYRNFGPQVTPKTAENLKADAFLQEMAKKCGGDFSKLTPEEQLKVNGFAGGRGAMAIAGIARGLKK
jgi:hypothetical protein